MTFSGSVEVLDASAFRFDMVPVRKSAFIESRVTLEQVETGMRKLTSGRLQVYHGRRVEYSMVSDGWRLITTVGDMGKGVIGIAVEYWGHCEQDFQLLLARIQRFAPLAPESTRIQV